MITEDARIIGNRSLGERYGLLSLRLKEMGRSFGPGQFVQMEIPGRPDLIMRRPMSPLRIVEEDGEFRMDVLYLVVGEGTRHLTGLREGGTINLLGPLGRSFAPPADHGPAFLVAGGTGLGPIYMLAQELCESHDVTFFYGARNAAELFCRDDIQAFRGRTVFCTDEGRGHRGVEATAFPDPTHLVRLRDEGHVGRGAGAVPGPGPGGPGLPGGTNGLRRGCVSFLRGGKHRRWLYDGVQGWTGFPSRGCGSDKWLKST